MSRVVSINEPGSQLKVVYFSDPLEVWIIVSIDIDKTIWKFVRDGDRVYARTPGTPYPKLSSQHWTYLTGRQAGKEYVTFILGNHEIS